jgi:hypothetical protein
MKNDSDVIDVALATISDQPSPVRVTPRMIWLRGIALERQRAAERALRVTRWLSAVGLSLVAVAGVFFASTVQIEMISDHAVAAAGSALILGITGLQFIRSPR